MKLVGTEIGSYTFDASAKTITFVDCGNVKLEDISSIINVTQGVVMYDKLEKTATMLSNVLSVETVTSAMADSDNLQIYISSGIVLSDGVYIPEYTKKIITEVSPTVTTIEYYNGIVVVATKTITVSGGGSITTIEMVYS